MAWLISKISSHRHTLGTLLVVLLVVPVLMVASSAQAEPTPRQLEEAMERLGLSREEALRLYREQEGATETTGQATERAPGRRDLRGLDDRRPQGQKTIEPVVDPAAGVRLSLHPTAEDSLGLVLDALDSPATVPASERIFGQDFFQLDEGLFQPPSFGPVSDSYILGVGDEITVDVWGEVEFRLVRVVDRNGAVILPGAGRVDCAGRSLSAVTADIRRKLHRLHASIDPDGMAGGDSGTSFLEVSLGSLRGIRVFVIGEVQRPGSFQVSSLSSVLGALYAAGGPSQQGSLREIRLVRTGEKPLKVDLYGYLLSGDRSQDHRLREGDTILVPARGATVKVEGAVLRPMRYEILPGEGLAQVIPFAGGLTDQASAEFIHVEMVVPPTERAPGQPDRRLLDVPFDPETQRPREGWGPALTGGSVVRVDSISDRLDNFVELRGKVKNPDRFEYQPGLRVAELIARAGGLWPDALLERASIDRTEPDGTLVSVSFDLAAELKGTGPQVELKAGDVVEIFALREEAIRAKVHISGEVQKPLSLDFRQGITLRDLILKAGGLRPGADPANIEIHRMKQEAVQSRDLMSKPRQTTETVRVTLDEDFLDQDDSVVLQPHDRVAVRRLPWWDMQRTVTLSGEVFFPGVFSLEKPDERLSAVIRRAGGVKPDAYLLGARVIRQQGEVGNIAIDLARALAEPGGTFDIIMMNGDQILVPEEMSTVKVVGEVGFPTSLVFEAERNIDYYVNRAGGYLENADKGKSRVVWPNGMSLPNKGGNRVVAGSTIIVPLKPPQDGKSALETMSEITAILAGLATVWLVIDNTSR